MCHLQSCIGDPSASVSPGLQEGLWTHFSFGWWGKISCSGETFGEQGRKTGQGRWQRSQQSSCRGLPGSSRAGGQFPSIPLGKRQEQLPWTDTQTHTAFQAPPACQHGKVLFPWTGHIKFLQSSHPSFAPLTMPDQLQKTKMRLLWFLNRGDKRKSNLVAPAPPLLRPSTPVHLSFPLPYIFSKAHC